ncbi:MAG: hypothetical protein HQ542_08070 [Bacteroidia bacterium]|nr:hypothetical protein [Bacteroidia bacterium]
MLDVASTSKGMLIPRMTVAQRDAISSPATGLIVYVTTYNKYYFYNGSAWILLVAGADDDWFFSGSDMYTFASGNSGYIGSSSYGVHGAHNNGNKGYLGDPDYGIYGYLASTGVGDYAIYGYGIHTDGITGTGYTSSSSKGGVKGYNYYGNAYTFGVAGFKWFHLNRSGSVLGADWNGDVFGSLCYQSSSGTEYGGYFTSTGSGTGKSSGTNADVGIGVWGDLFGADIHGNIYGLFAEGGNYAIYAHGDVYRDGLDVHLQTSVNEDSIPLYTMVSTDAVIQTCGYASLSGGSCDIAFDETFVNAVSSAEPEHRKSERRVHDNSTNGESHEERSGKLSAYR